MSKIGLSRIAVNARLGDGRLGDSKNASISFYSTDKLLLDHKEKMLLEEGYENIKWGTQLSGYGGTKTIYKLTTKVSEKATAVRDIPINELLEVLDEHDLILWYLDDGSWHVNNQTMHLYSNMLDAEQTQILVNRIEQLYGVAPAIRKDRKRDGREFLYLYFPRYLVEKFRPVVLSFLVENELSSLFYKVGGLDCEIKPIRTLSIEDIREIREMHRVGTSLREIAEQKGLKYFRVRDVATYKTYKNVI